MPSPPLPRRVVLLSGLTAIPTLPHHVVVQQAGSGPGTGSSGSDSSGADPVGNETEPTSEPTTDRFEPEVDVDCYVASVDAERYDSVELTFADGPTATFADGYSGRNRFGFSGDGTVEIEAPTAIEEFRGPIQQVTVTAGETTATVDRGTDACPFEDLAFECDRVRHGQAGDVRMSFVDGSFKQWDPPADSQEWFGSPGRVIETITEESVDIEVTNPNSDCEPGAYGTVFDCTEVTITDAEFDAEPTFDWIELQFTDGSTQAFGDRTDGPNFRAPETFAGTDDHAGKLIDSVLLTKRGGDISFRLVNPTVDDCAAPSASAHGPKSEQVGSDDGEPTSEATESASTGSRESTAMGSDS